MSVDSLLSGLKNASRTDATANGAPSTSGGGGKLLKSTAASSVLGGQAASAANSFVLDGLFASIRLMPIRRPSGDDEVGAI